MDPKEVRKRIESAYQLLQEETTTRERFESVRTLVRGINPQIDRRFDTVSHALSEVEKFQKGEVIELTAGYLPDRTQYEKERKRVLLLFIRTWKQLHSEVERVMSEIEKMKEQESVEEQATSVSKIVGLAKGPFGIITLLALIVMGAVAFMNSDKTQNPESSPSSSGEAKIKVIVVDGKKIPLSEVRVGEGLECEGLHYHANRGTAARSLDGTLVPDPGGCGYGKVSEVEVVEETTLQ